MNWVYRFRAWLAAPSPREVARFREELARRQPHATDRPPRFTNGCRRAMARANAEAERFNHEFLGPEHILLGLIGAADGVNRVLFRKSRVKLRRMRVQLPRFVLTGTQPPRGGPLPHMPTARKVIDGAVLLAEQSGDAYVREDQLLSAILSTNQDTIALSMLREEGLDPNELRRELERLQANSKNA